VLLKNGTLLLNPERCWVDYATVFYWYQDRPGGYDHAPLGSPAERRAVMLHPNRVSPAERPAEKRP